MAIEIVDFPIKHGDFPWQNVSSLEGNDMFRGIHEINDHGIDVMNPIGMNGFY